MKTTALITICMVLFCASLHGKESVAEMEAKGIAALKLSATVPDSIVTAAIYFGKAAEAYEKAGDDTKSSEMNSFLYWCKKKMTFDQIDTFLKGGDAALAAVAKRMNSVEKIAPKPDDAKVYFNRAEKYAADHPNEHLLIAIRFFEVADRLKGSEVGQKAQDRSLQEMMLSAQSTPAAKPASAAPAVSAPIAVKKSPTPSAAKLKKAEALILDVFKAELLMNSSADKLALAQKMVAQADDNKDDPAARYELLILSAHLSAQAGDIDVTNDSMDKLATEFEGDTHVLRKTNLGLITTNTKDVNLSRLATAFKTLLDWPDDPTAALIVGKYRCFVKGDFERGAALLAKSNHPVLSKLAKLELAKPTQSATQIALGDEWWDASEKADKDDSSHYKERAVFWYGKVLPTVSGLIKTKLEKRLAASGGGTAPASKVATGSSIGRITDFVLPPIENPTDGSCPVCHGLKIVPRSPYKPHARIDGEPMTTPLAPPWKLCENCQKGKDDQTLIVEMQEAEARARVKHAALVEKSGVKMDLILTSFFSLHSNLPAAVAKKHAQELEKLYEKLQTNFKSMVCAKNRVDITDVFLLKDKQSYDTIIDTHYPDYAHMKSGTSLSSVNVVIMVPHSETEYNRLISMASDMVIESIPDGDAPNWIRSGFQGYCLDLTFPASGLFGGRPDPNEHYLPNLNAMMNGYAKGGKLKHWEELFTLQMSSETSADWIHCRSIVTYLIALDPARFATLARSVTQKQDSMANVEKVYGRKIDELEAHWRKWILTQK